MCAIVAKTMSSDLWPDLTMRIHRILPLCDIRTQQISAGNEAISLFGSQTSVSLIPGGFEDELENVIRFAGDGTEGDEEDTKYLSYSGIQLH